MPRLKKWNDDLYVPVDARRLQAVIRESGLSVTQVARRIGYPQPTLHCMVSGKTKTCRQKLRRALARTLKIKEAWLGGDPNAGPHDDRLLRLAAEDAHIEVRPDEYQTQPPPLAQLRGANLIDQCLSRWEEDLAAGIAPVPPGTLGEVYQSLEGDTRRAWFGAYLSNLLFSPSTFRAQVYQFPGAPGEGDFELISWWVSNEDSFAAHWIMALRELLDPWLEGERSLNYPACYALLGALSAAGGNVMRSTDRAVFARLIAERKGDA